jgi:anti-sigma-K factor RskA
MNRRQSRQHGLAGAYVLDAIDARDRTRFERHLDRCSACSAEVSELGEAAARLACAAAADPPPGLIEQAVTSAAHVRQLPPSNDPHPWRQIGPVRQQRRPSGRGSGPRRRLSAVGVLAAVFLVAASALGATVWHAEDQVAIAQQRGYQIARVLNAPDAVMLSARVTAGGTATVVMSHRDRSLVFTTAGLRPLPPDRCYQLWLMGPAGDRSAGMLLAAHDGMTNPVIATDIRAGDRLGLTIEPEGGAPLPTSAPILIMTLA